MMPLAPGAAKRWPPLRVRLSEGLGSARHAHLVVAAFLSLIDCCNDDGQMALDSWPTGGEQDDDSHAAAGKVLLILQILVCRHEDFESCFLGGCDQFAVLKLGPAAFMGCCDFVPFQRPSEWRWRALIEQNLHSGGFKGATRCVLKN